MELKTNLDAFLQNQFKTKNKPSTVQSTVKPYEARSKYSNYKKSAENSSLSKKYSEIKKTYEQSKNNYKKMIGSRKQSAVVKHKQSYHNPNSMSFDNSDSTYKMQKPTLKAKYGDKKRKSVHDSKSITNNLKLSSAHKSLISTCDPSVAGKRSTTPVEHYKNVFSNKHADYAKYRSPTDLKQPSFDHLNMSNTSNNSHHKSISQSKYKVSIVLQSNNIMMI